MGSQLKDNGYNLCLTAIQFEQLIDLVNLPMSPTLDGKVTEFDI